MASMIYLDVCELPAPEPLNKVLELLGTSDKSDIVCMKHRQRPELLFEILVKRGFHYHLKSNENTFLIYIWHASNVDAMEVITRENLSVPE